jgi:hypothetical protein
MAFFGLKCEPKKWTPFVPPPEEALRLHISQVRARHAPNDQIPPPVDRASLTAAGPESGASCR